MTVLVVLIALNLPIDAFAFEDNLQSEMFQPVSSVSDNGDGTFTCTCYYVLQYDWTGYYGGNTLVEIQFISNTSDCKFVFQKYLSSDLVSLGFCGNTSASNIRSVNVNFIDLISGTLKYTRSYGLTDYYGFFLGTRYWYGVFLMPDLSIDSGRGFLLDSVFEYTIIGTYPTIYNTPFNVEWARKPLISKSFKSELSEPVADAYNYYVTSGDKLIWISFDNFSFYTNSQKYVNSFEEIAESAVLDIETSGVVNGTSSVSLSEVAGISLTSTSSSQSDIEFLSRFQEDAENNGYQFLSDGLFISLPSSSTSFQGHISSGFSVPDIESSGSLNTSSSGTIGGSYKSAVSGSEIYSLTDSSSGSGTIGYVVPLYKVESSSSTTPTLLPYILRLNIDSSGNLSLILVRSSKLDSDVIVYVSGNFYLGIFDLLDGELISQSTFNISKILNSGITSVFSNFFKVENDLRVYGVKYYNVALYPASLSNIHWQYDFDFREWQISNLARLDSIIEILNQNVAPEVETNEDFVQALNSYNPNFNGSSSNDFKSFFDGIDLNQYSGSASSLSDLIEMFSYPPLIAICVLSLTVGLIILILGKKKGD